MTLDEKIAYLGGDREFYVRAMPRLGLPAIKMVDGPMGTRNDGPSTCYAGGVALAATWDVDLARRTGVAMARDARARGAHILLAPGVNISRSPHCGRNFEYLGEDPLLAGTMASAFIRGVQGQGVLATVKHFACNNQEWDRNRISSEVDERTLREIYLPAFRQAVQTGGVAAVMTAYNLLNGQHCTEHGWLVDTVLRGEWGFRGIVMSDWQAVHDAKAAFLGGTDLEMPSGKFINAASLTPLLASGAITEAQIDAKVERLLTTIIAACFLDRPQEDPTLARHGDPAQAAVALEGARAALVLAKNDGGLLPVAPAAVRRLLVVGPNAQPAVYCGSGSGYVEAPGAVSVLDGLRAAYPAATVEHHVGLQRTGEVLTDAAPLRAAAAQADLVVVCVGYGQSAATNSAAQAYKPFWPDRGARALGIIEAEDSDRPFALHPAQVATLQAVLAANRRVVVVLNAGGGVDPAGWGDQAAAIIVAWYPGQAVGTAVAEVVSGAVNPSGHLPVTFARQEGDYPSAPFYHVNDHGKTPYGEGVFVGYRGFDAAGTAPWFAFGHGLSYTTFAYRDLTVTPNPDGTAAVEFTLQNTGAREGAEVAQVYVTPAQAPVPRPPRELKGFVRVRLAAGEERRLRVDLPADAWACWNPAAKGWVTAPGTYGIQVGASSREVRLTGTITR